MNKSTDAFSKSSNASEVEASSPTLPSDKPSDAPRPLEFESWMDRAIAGMRRMATDPAYREEIERKLLRR